MQAELDALNGAVSDIAGSAQALAQRHLAFLVHLDVSVSNILREIETYIHPDRAKDIRTFHDQAQVMGGAIHNEAAALAAKVPAAHEALHALAKAVTAKPSA